MRLNDIADLTVNYLFGRLLRRAVGAAVLTVFILVAAYYATSAGTLALAIKVGTLYAYLIMAAIYAAAALIVLAVLWATRNKPAAALTQSATASPLASPRNMQIAMLIEAVMLGYAMAKKPGERLR
jgi:hypothetical protein